MRPRSGARADSRAASSRPVGHRPLAQHHAVGIVGIGGGAQHRRGVVRLARAQQQPGDLGRLAEADRQQAGRQRIKAAGMATLVGAEQVPHLLQRLVGADPGRLVQQQQAVERPEHGAGALRFSHRSPAPGPCRSGFSRDRGSAATIPVISGTAPGQEQPHKGGVDPWNRPSGASGDACARAPALSSSVQFPSRLKPRLQSTGREQDATSVGRVVRQGRVVAQQVVDALATIDRIVVVEMKLRHMPHLHRARRACNGSQAPAPSGP